ncbi:MAG: Re/Si-specific NAD(P)(+) transhydrogenase subunit alpha [Chloroflexi bacterium]|nr:Re/Si-specific NAD(P)(+) transhydrogenase subunit alpha [Chloroflexota bacterium]
MRIGVPKESAPTERRVALVPDTLGRLVKVGMEVLVESGAGEAAYFSDEMYQEAGGTVVPDVPSLLGNAEVVLKVQAPGMNDVLGKHEVDMMAEGAILIALLQPLINLELVQRLVDKGITSFSMDTIPRIARAQSMDALSSMSSLAGYKAALMAASTLGKYFPMMMTAAGTYPPARGLVLGAGVAGLQAIATARRLGAVMQAFDVRPAVKQEVESLGATFVGMTPAGEEVEDTGGYARELAQGTQRQERELIHRHTREADFVITTALVPGRPAPILITGDMVKDMKPGSVIVDLAAEAGGNCELTVPGAEVVKYGVTIQGYLNLPSTMPTHASQMYSRNISTLLLHLVKDNQLSLDFEDTITRGCCITHQGNVVYGPTQALLGKGAMS